MRHRDREGIERLERNGTMAQPPDQPVVCVAEADLLDRQVRSILRTTAGMSAP
jgi:hypothetical protein